MNGEDRLSSPNVIACPRCGSPMKLRTAKQGKHAGNQFWGCSTFPKCRGIRSFDAVSKPIEIRPESKEPRREKSNAPALPSLLPVVWIESAPRSDFISEYVTAGCMPGTLHRQLAGNPTLERSLTQCLMLSSRNRPRQNASEHARLVGSLLRKILQRGRTPLPTLEVELEALRRHELLDKARDLKNDTSELGWELPESITRTLDPENVTAAILKRNEFSLEPSMAFNAGSSALVQTRAEAWFLEQWVPGVLGPSAGHWFTPQASLDTLLESRGLEKSGERRIDFLFCHPGGPPLGIEIDGEEHASAILVDQARDASLKRMGIEVLRITHDEIRRKGGIVLNQIKRRCETALTALKPSPADENIGSFLLDCTNAAKAQFAIAHAVKWGWLTAGKSWHLELVGANPSIAAGVLDALRLLTELDALYGGNSVPACCSVRCDPGFSIAWTLDNKGKWQKTTAPEISGDSLRLSIESYHGPYQRIDLENQADLILRPAFLPVEFASERASILSRRAVSSEAYEKAHSSLEFFLQNIFRKQCFRSMQSEAIFNALRQKNCVVLLPTGAGKSLIYQLAGLLMPGMTLVVDPLVSLIEDQVEGMRSYGIDRAAPITGKLSSSDERKRLLLRVEHGEYHFVLVAPERLQSPNFRNTLKALTNVSSINLAVIDEAHCVSEWGHDFRPAYLKLGDNLRRFGTGQDGSSPPLLALTGTASRAVLRDMIVDLNIDQTRSDALIRPPSFDRPELYFRIIRTRPPEDPNAALRGALNGLPDRLNLPITEVFQPAGRRTASGIIFVPTVTARNYGLDEASKTVQSATNANVTVYAGQPPNKNITEAEWTIRKRKNASDFKANRVPVLVATKAFGMGIDKPNIRYTVHFGMPGSLESFYQEAGRAGRDQRPAVCVIVFSEYDDKRTDSLLDPSLDLEELRAHWKKESQSARVRDDVIRALWFHFKGYSGSKQDIEDIKERLNEIGDLTKRRTIEIPFAQFGQNRAGNERKSKEKSLYRLLRIGVLSDYEVDFGAGKFVLTTEKFDPERSKKLLLDYVRAAQPAKSKMLSSRLDSLPAEDPHGSVIKLATELIVFTYDLIERSRRRMIQESMLLARRAKNDKDIRARLLDYLQEGFGAEHIDQLLNQPDIALRNWCDLIDKCQTAIDAGELRGLCIRALESYPDHPGLLLTRGVAETLCSDHDENVSTNEIGRAVLKAIVGYQLGKKELKAIIERLFDLATTRAHGLGFPLVTSLLRLPDQSEKLSFAVDLALKKAGEVLDPRGKIAALNHRIHRLTKGLRSPVSFLERRYDASGVRQALS